jgi:hypothetical protein
MKVVDRVETQEQVEKLSEDQRDDLFTRLIMGKDVIEEVDTSRGKFTVKYPKAADFIMIGKIAAFRRGHKPIAAFDNGTEMTNMMASTLDVVVVSGPKWFEDAKKTNQNFSFLEVPSQMFLSELYGKVYSFREKVESRFNTPEGASDTPVSPEKSAPDPVDGGAFGGLSGEFGDTTPE